MCDWTSAGLAGAGLLSSFAGSAMNAGAADQVAQARAGALRTHRYQQRNFDEESDRLTRQERARYDNAQGQIDTRAQSVADMYRGNNASLPNSGPTAGAIPTSSSNLTVQEGKKQQSKVAAFGNQQGDALANLRSFGDVLGEAGRGVNRDRADLANVGNFKQGSASVLPLGLDAASYAGEDQRQLADMFSGVGKIATTVGLSRGPGISIKKTGSTPIPFQSIAGSYYGV